MWLFAEGTPEASAKMAYPEATPALRGRQAREFLRKLREFELTPEQKEFWRGALEDYEATTARSRARRRG